MVAISKFGFYEVYILPSGGDSKSNLATVRYKGIITSACPSKKGNGEENVAAEVSSPRRIVACEAVVSNFDLFEGFFSPEKLIPEVVAGNPCDLMAKGISEPGNTAGPNTSFERTYAIAHTTFLKTLGQAHCSWIFGAIAELVDNSRDAKAAKLEVAVNTVYSKSAGKDIPMLGIVDDGHGMRHAEILKMVTFGRGQTEACDPDCIGRYGIGFKAYKRVGSMIHNGDRGRGIIGVIDVTDLMLQSRGNSATRLKNHGTTLLPTGLLNESNGHVWVHNNKQGFQDCEAYAELEKWLGERADRYLDNNVDKIQVAVVMKFMLNTKTIWISGPKSGHEFAL